MALVDRCERDGMVRRCAARARLAAGVWMLCAGVGCASTLAASEPERSGDPRIAEPVAGTAPTHGAPADGAAPPTQDLAVGGGEVSAPDDPASEARATTAEAAAPSEAASRPADVTTVSVIVHLATAAGASVMEEAQLRSWFALAEQHFAAAGIAFNAELRPLPEGFAELARIRDRHALKRFLVPHRINVFVVGRMLDPVASEATKRAAAWQGFTPSGKLAGAHIEADGKQPKTYLIVSAADGSGITLTHELGHFFGVAHHRDPENIMSYGAQRNRFEEAQLKTFRHTLRALLRGRVLR